MYNVISQINGLVSSRISIGTTLVINATSISLIYQKIFGSNQTNNEMITLLDPSKIILPSFCQLSPTNCSTPVMSQVKKYTNN